MQKTLQRFSLAIAVILLCSISVVYASGFYWKDSFTTNNFRYTGSVSDDYWLVVTNNENLTKTITDGKLILNFTRSSGSNEQSWICKRAINASAPITAEFSFSLSSASDSEFGAELGAMYNSTTWLWKIEISSSSVKLGFNSPTGSWTTKTLSTSFTKDEYHTVSVTLGNNTVTAEMDDVSYSYDCLFTYDDCNNAEASFILKAKLLQGATASTGEIYFDYIEWGSPTSTMKQIIPTILSLALLTVCIGLVTKAVKW